MDKQRFTQRLLRPSQVSEALSVSPSTLSRWRARAEGPPWFMVGKAVFYPEKEIRQWIDDKLTQTQDVGIYEG